MDAHRDCPHCAGKVTVWEFGNQIYRVTGRKNEFGEVDDFICNECRFEKKDIHDWVIEGPRKITPRSVISQNHYRNTKKQSIILPLDEKTEPQQQ